MRDSFLSTISTKNEKKISLPVNISNRLNKKNYINGQLKRYLLLSNRKMCSRSTHSIIIIIIKCNENQQNHYNEKYNREMKKTKK